MSILLLKNADTILTMDDNDNVFDKCDVLVEGNVITKIGQGLTPPPDATVINMEGKAILPGFVNTHHHLYQTLFRGLPEVQEMPLFPWLKGLYEFWKYLGSETVYHGARVGFAELLLTGCTTSTDHHYVFPRGQEGLIEAQFQAADEMGMRFHATRGSMSLSVKDGGLPPESVVQTEEEILESSSLLIEKFHDKNKYAMKRIALAPCSPFSVTEKLLTETAALAEKYGVMLHTHLCETMDEENFCLEKYGRRPLNLMEDCGWLNDRTWFAHGIWFNDEEIGILKKAGVGIAHCPSSNMKLGSGICRTTELYKAGVKLGIAVDGSASNDASNMFEEVRRAYLLNHLKYATDGLNALEILRLATRGGADVLGMGDYIGAITPGYAADIIAINLKDVAYAGCHTVPSAIVACGNTSIVDTSIINGKIVVKDGKLVTANVEDVRKEAVAHAEGLVSKRRQEGR